MKMSFTDEPMKTYKVDGERVKKTREKKHMGERQQIMYPQITQRANKNDYRRSVFTRNSQTI